MKKQLFTTFMFAIGLLLLGCNKNYAQISCNIGDEKIVMAEKDLKEINGVVSVLIVDDFQNSRSEEIYYLTTKDGKKYQLKFCDGVEVKTPLSSNQHISVKGFEKDNIFYVLEIN